MDRDEFAGWVPIHVAPIAGDLEIDWCRFGGRRCIEPFFEDSVTLALREPFNQAFRRKTSARELLEWARLSPGIRPTAFIFHASRCGSTLLAQMLAALPRYIVVSEPPMLDAVLPLRTNQAEVGQETRVAWLRGLVSALAQPMHGETQFAIKLDAWNILESEFLRRAFPDTPCIFLYRDPAEIGASQLAMRGSYLVPGRLDPSPFGFDLPESLAWTAEEYIARALGQVLSAGAAACAAHGAIPVHYEELPELASAPLRALLGISAGDQDTMKNAAQRDAKNPQIPFASGDARPRREVSIVMRGQIEKWATPAYRELEALRAARIRLG